MSGTKFINNYSIIYSLKIFRLYNKMKETGELNGDENEAFRNIIHPICKIFAGEQLMSDISLIRDSVVSNNEFTDLINH